MQRAISSTSRRSALCGVVLGVLALLSSPVAAQEGVEASAAQGLSGIKLVPRGSEVQIYSVELQDGTVAFDDVDLGWPGTNNGIELIINDLTASTGFQSSDIAALRLYRSTDAVFDATDILVATAGALAPLGAATTLNATGAGANRRIPVTPASIFFVATAVIANSATSGHAFTVAALNQHVGLEETGFFSVSQEVGSAVVASDANHIAIGTAAKAASPGATIPFGGEPAMLFVLVGSGAWVILRRS
jgi:hypothetical protein